MRVARLVRSSCFVWNGQMSANVKLEFFLSLIARFLQAPYVLPFQNSEDRHDWKVVD